VIALVITSLVRLRLGYGAWRAVHWLAYACWPIALVHGLGTGTDARRGWSLALDGVFVAAVVGATVWRIATSTTVAWRRRAGAVGATIAVVAGVFAWTLVGPLQNGWARRAGTPVSILGSKGVAASAPANSAPRTNTPSSSFSIPFSAQLTGTVNEQAPDANGKAIVVIDAQLRGGATGRVHIALQGAALSSGGLQMERSRAYLGTVAVPSLYAGNVTALQGTHIVAGLRAADGKRAQLSLDIVIGANGALTGNAQALTENG
jgi:hypothetical protein